MVDDSEDSADLVDRIVRMAGIKLSAVAKHWLPRKSLNDLNDVYQTVTHVIEQWQSSLPWDCQASQVAVDCTSIGKKSLYLTLSQACQFRQADGITFTSKSIEERLKSDTDVGEFVIAEVMYSHLFGLLTGEDW